MDHEVILIIDGCGCMGYHIVKAVSQQPSFKFVNVFPRNPTVNFQSGVSYHAGSLTTPEDINFRPHQTNLDFPRRIAPSPSEIPRMQISSAKSIFIILYTKSLVYTSSTTVSKSSYHFNDETQPLIDLNSKADFNYYTVTKAIADIAVCKANNSKGLRTCCLRIAPINGKHDVQMIPGTLGVLPKDHHHSQIGDNTALVDFVSSSYLSRKVLKNFQADSSQNGKISPKISGEAFFITDGNPVHFWGFAHKVWAAAGTIVDCKDIRVFSAWFMMDLRL
ncbi:hypothetical protein EAF00_004577 [Botryotinia globosa]|nr:hypothetical protein EAF00_004577 [Botryotinia globosa]